MSSSHRPHIVKQGNGDVPVMSVAVATMLAQNVPVADSTPETTEMGGDLLTLCEIARDQLGMQMAAAAVPEAKVGTYFGVGSALAGLLMAILALRPPQTALEILFASLVGGAYLGLTFLCLLAYRSDEWWYGPDLRKSIAKWPQRSVEANKWHLVTTLVTHYEHNETPYHHKLERARRAAAFLIAETICLGVLALLVSRV